MTTIRLAGPEDFEFFYQLKCEDSNIFWTGHDRAPDYDGLKNFFDNILSHQSEDNVRKIYIIMDENIPVGQIYLNPEPPHPSGVRVLDIPCAVSEKHWGKGYAKQAIQLAFDEAKRLGSHKLRGSIREDNLASMRAYIACGAKVLDEYKNVFIPGVGQEVKMFIVEKDL